MFVFIYFIYIFIFYFNKIFLNKKKNETFFFYKNKSNRIKLNLKKILYFYQIFFFKKINLKLFSLFFFFFFSNFYFFYCSFFFFIFNKNAEITFLNFFSKKKNSLFINLYNNNNLFILKKKNSLLNYFKNEFKKLNFSFIDYKFILIKKNKLFYYVIFFASNLIKNYSIISFKKINLNFLRKNRIFNKGRYSRNRQNYRTGVYWCLYINIIAVVGLYFWFYRFNINFGYIWWFFFLFFFYFFINRLIKFNLFRFYEIFNSLILDLVWFGSILRIVINYFYIFLKKFKSKFYLYFFFIF